MTRSCSHSNILVDTIVKNVLHVRTIIVLYEMHELLTFQILKHSLTEKQPWLLAVQSQQHICMLYVYGMSDQNYNVSTESEQLHKWGSNSNIIITNSFDILQIKQIVYWYQECTKKWLTASKVLSTLRPVTRIKRIPAAKHAKSTQRFGLFSKPVLHKNCDKLHLLHTSRACCIQSEPVACQFLPKPVMPDSRK